MYHTGKLAPDAESLMRSRYSAYALGLHVYILETWHPSTRPERLEPDTFPKWVGLKIKAAAYDTVEYVAKYKVNGRAYRMHETSRFVCESGAWFYLEGTLHE